MERNNKLEGDIVKKKKVLFISSTGGHLSELMRLSPMFLKYNYFIITEKTKSNLGLREIYPKKVGFLVYGTKRKILTYPFKLIYNSFKSLFYFIKFRPDVVVTTGTHTAGPMCCIAKLFRKKVVYIETLANSNTKTATGRLLYHIADLFIVQWEDMLKLYPKAKYGGWIY